MFFVKLYDIESIGCYLNTNFIQPWWLSLLGRQLSLSRVEGINKRMVDRIPPSMACQSFRGGNPLLLFK